MLSLIVFGKELWNETTEEFETLEDEVLELEHSLVSLSKWESKFKKPFLTAGQKTNEEILAYIEAMIISPGVNPQIFSRFTQEHFNKIDEYINSPESATTFGKLPERKSRGETITSELIYYWMVAYNIPFECESWHLNRLFALIRICNLKNSKPQKMNRHEQAIERARINEERKALLGTSG